MHRRITAGVAAAILASVSLLSAPAHAGAPAPKVPPKAAGHGLPSIPGHPLARDAKLGKLATTRDYQGIHQFIGNGTTTGSTGEAVLVSQHKPYLNSAAGDGHSLWEVAVESYDGQQIAEIGWRIAPQHYGDTNPHLFTSAWINGTFTGYAGITSIWPNSGWVDNPAVAVNAGTSLAYTASGSVPSLYYQYRIDYVSSTPSWAPAGTGGGMVVSQKNQGATDRPIGIWPSSLWTAAGATFNKIGLFQAFNEVAETSGSGWSCSDAGSGAFGASTATSSLDELAYSHIGAPVDPGTGVTETNVPDGVSVTPASASPSAYRAYQYPTDLDRVRLGGPGRNASNTGTGSIGSC